MVRNSTLPAEHDANSRFERFELNTRVICLVFIDWLIQILKQRDALLSKESDSCDGHRNDDLDESSIIAVARLREREAESKNSQMRGVRPRGDAGPATLRSDGAPLF